MNFNLTAKRRRALSLEWFTFVFNKICWLTLFILDLISCHWHQVIAWITRSCFNSCYKLHNLADLCLTFIRMERTNYRLCFWLERIVRIMRLVIVAYVVFFLRLDFWLKFNLTRTIVREIIFCVWTCRGLHGSGRISWNLKPICIFRWAFWARFCEGGILQ